MEMDELAYVRPHFPKLDVRPVICLDLATFLVLVAVFYGERYIFMLFFLLT